jgi:hypothetical protein
MFYCCWQHQFATETFSCNTQYCYIVNSDMQLNSTYRTHCCFCVATMVKQKHHKLHYTQLPIFIKFILFVLSYSLFICTWFLKQVLYYAILVNVFTHENIKQLVKKLIRFQRHIKSLFYSKSMVCHHVVKIYLLQYKSTSNTTTYLMQFNYFRIQLGSAKSQQFEKCRNTRI